MTSLPRYRSINKPPRKDLKHGWSIRTLIAIKSDEARRIAVNIAKLPGAVAEAVVF
jgi:hypothetical protein